MTKSPATCTWCKSIPQYTVWPEHPAQDYYPVCWSHLQRQIDELLGDVTNVTVGRRL